MSTIANVAARAGVSKATASRALSGRGYVSDATRLRVKAAASELSYIAHSSATSLATGRTQTVGVVSPPVNRWYFTELLGGIQDALLTLGYDLTLYGIREHTSARSHLFGSVLPSRRFDGIIAVNIHPDADELERLSRFGRPLVSVGAYVDPPVRCTVAIDDEAAGRIATEHLIGLGHRDIAFLGGVDDDDGLSLGDARRVAGYLEALHSAGIADRARICAAATNMPGGYAAAAELLADRRNRPTAIVGVCDEVAIGAMIATRRLGIAVPTEFSIIGVDDHQDAEMFSLTTIRQLPREQGDEAVSLLMAQIDDPDTPARQVTASSVLVVRASTAAAR